MIAFVCLIIALTCGATEHQTAAGYWVVAMVFSLLGYAEMAIRWAASEPTKKPDETQS